MSYKNSMKLLASNFMLVWKQVLCLFICFGIAIFFTYTTAQPILSLLKSNGVINELKLLVDSIYHAPSELAYDISIFLRLLLNVIFSNFSSIWGSLLSLLCFGIFIPYLITQMSFYNITSILYQKFTMNMNVNYFQNALATLKQSLKFAFANILLSIPFLGIVILLIDIYLMLASNIITAIIGLIILCALLILAISIQITLYTCFMGYMIESESNPLISFAKGSITSLKNFWKILSQSIIVVLTIIFVNGIIALFTFFSGLFVTIPATFVFIAIYYLVVYFNVKGERYYLSNNMIFNPTKYVIKKDDFSGTEIPEEPKEIEVKTIVMKKKKTSKTDKKDKSKTKKQKNKKNKKG